MRNTCLCATSLIQLLHVYFNRQWKLIALRIFDHIQLDDIAINSSERNNIIRLNSLIHNQLSSSLFILVMKYSQFTEGYVNQHPGNLESVNEFCFNVDGNFCQQLNCHLLPFIQWSYCHKFVSFEHFFEACHYHA